MSEKAKNKNSLVIIAVVILIALIAAFAINSRKKPEPLPSQSPTTETGQKPAESPATTPVETSSTTTPPDIAQDDSEIKRKKIEKLVDEADALLRQRKYDEAMEKINQAVKLDPDQPSILSVRGRLYSQLRQFDKAEPDLNKAVKVSPDLHLNWVNRGNLYYYTNRNDLAIKDFKKAIELDPEGSRHYYGLGRIYYDSRKYDKAVEQFDVAIEKSTKMKDDRGTARNLASRGIALTKMNKLDEAEKDLMKSYKIRPEKASTLCALSDVYEERGNQEKALDYLNQAINLDPDMNKDPDFSDPKNSTNPYADRAALFSDRQQYEKALEDYNKALKLQNRQKTIMVERAQVLVKLNRKEEAKRDVQKWLKGKRRFRRPRTLEIAARAYMVLEDYEKALELINKAIKKMPENAIFYNDRLEIYIKMGRKAEAEADAEKALKLGKPSEVKITKRLMKKMNKM